MNYSHKIIFLLLVFFFSSLMAQTTAEQDRLKLREFFSKSYSSIDLNDFIDGAYIFNEKAKQQWLEIEDFPPYEFDIEEGEVLFNTSFANDKNYADCFKNKGIGIKQNYPLWDELAMKVITLELAINNCREKNHEAPLAYGTGEMAKLSAYMTSTSRDEIIDIPEPVGKAFEAYEVGKKYYYSKRGQLNMACANCHLATAHLNLRYEIPGPMLGQVTNWPVYRSKWQQIGTIHHRFRECNSQVRAKPLEYQSDVYRNLEYFLTYMSKGLKLNGPGSRK